MPTRSISARLEAGDVLLMDGATGDQLSRRGADISKGTSFDDSNPISALDYLKETDPAEMRRVHENFLRQLGPWSAPANIDSPDIVREIHESYLRLGADIIISNTFWTSAPPLATIGLADEWERYTRAGGELALQARDAINPEAYVAGGIAPPLDGDLGYEFREQARVLADVGVDFMLPEYVGAIDQCVTAVEACSTSGLPVLLGIRAASSAGTMQYRERFEDLVRALEGLPVVAILLMCTGPDRVSIGLPQLRAAFPGPVGAYAHNPDDGGSEADECARFAGYGQEWLDLGAQIIGGCCGTGPEHIAALAPLVRSRSEVAG